MQKHIISAVSITPRMVCPALRVKRPSILSGSSFLCLRRQSQKITMATRYNESKHTISSTPGCIHIAPSHYETSQCAREPAWVQNHSRLAGKGFRFISGDLAGHHRQRRKKVSQKDLFHET